jgi:hypothetical protein
MSGSVSISEQELQAQLELPLGVGRRRYSAKIRIAQIGYWRSEGRRVKGIERLRAELQSHRFPPRQSEVSKDGEIYIVGSIIAKDVASGASERERRWTGEGRGIEPA